MGRVLVPKVGTGVFEGGKAQFVRHLREFTQCPRDSFGGFPSPPEPYGSIFLDVSNRAMSSDRDTGEHWVDSLANFLRCGEGVEAVRLDTGGGKLAIATLGHVEVERASPEALIGNKSPSR